jgi:hypothetical protein
MPFSPKFDLKAVYWGDGLAVVVILIAAPTIVITVVRFRRNYRTSPDYHSSDSPEDRSNHELEPPDELPSPSIGFREVFTKALIVIFFFMTITLRFLLRRDNNLLSRLTDTSIIGFTRSDTSLTYDDAFHTLPPHCEGAALHQPENLVGAYGEMESLYHRIIHNNTDLSGKLFDQGVIHIFGFNAVEAIRNFEAAIKVLERS